MKDLEQKTLAEPFGKEDFLLPFQLEASVLRGQMVRLGPVIETLLSQHAYPDPVARLLAEATALAAALGSAMKFDGVFTLQARGSGPVSLLVVDVTSDGALRAHARFLSEALPEAAGRSLLGAGHLVFTVDQKLGAERYQGIVGLEGESLTEAFQTYFRQSEQIQTGLLTAARKDEAGHWRAGCLLLQRMPREGGEALPPSDTSAPDDWLRAMALMQSCTEAELASPTLSGEDLLYRLFHEEGVRVYDKRFFRAECRCSREKLLKVLRGMPEEERKGLFVDGKLEAVCEFCGKKEIFAEKDMVP